MKKQNIRSKFVKEALVDSYNLSQSIKEGTKDTIEKLLRETVKDQFSKLINESSDDFDDEEEDVPEVSEVEDTASEGSSEDSNDAQEDTVGKEDDTLPKETDEPSEEGDDVDSNVEDSSMDGEGDDDWSEFEDYKLSDNEYDVSNTDDDTFAKVYKLLTPNDEVKVIPQGENQVQIKDEANNAEYLIDMSGSEESGEMEEGCEGGNAQNEEGSMNVYEVALKEYNSNVGYTDSYQKSDTMSNDGVKEPAPNDVNDWDKGVPHDTKKPWGGEVKKTAPFNNKAKTKQVEESCTKEECNEEMGDEQMIETPIEEANLSQSRWNDTHAVHNRVPAANKDEYRRDGMQKTSKGTKYRANGSSDEIKEDINKLKEMVARTSIINEENKELKKQIGTFRRLVEHVNLINKNLGNMVEVIMNNTTSKDEKKQIVERFQSVKSIEESNSLKEQIVKELRGKNVVNESNLNLDKKYTSNSSKKLNETTIVEDPKLDKIRGLMKQLDNYTY